jgi:sarcosine oxidase subunit alpha
MVSGAKDFLGRRSLARPDSQREDRKQLVGLLSEDPKLVLPEGAQIVARVTPEPPMPMIGHVTSSYWSANLGRSIALALVRGGRARHGETVCLPLAKQQVNATICEPVFLDAKGERMHG